MGSLNDFGDFQIADEEPRKKVTVEMIDSSYGNSPDDFVREDSFVTGVSSHSKVAEIEAGEDKQLKIGSPPALPGKRIAGMPNEPGKKVVVPDNFSKWGDFRHPIKMSAESPEDRGKCDLKLTQAALDPMRTQVRRKR